MKQQPLMELVHGKNSGIFHSFDSTIFTINMVLCMKNFLMAFDQIVAMTGGGPNSSTESISYLIYKTGLSGSQFGYQCANSVIYFIVIVLISVFQMKFLNKREVQL